MMETKSEYKLTEIGDIPVEWDIARMGSIGSTYGGLSGKTKADFEDGNENFVSYRQIFNNPLLRNEDFEMVRIFEKENQNEVKYGDVLFTTSSETPDEVAMSSVFLIEGEKKHFLNSFSFGYRWNQLEIIDPKYYGYYFRGEYFRQLTFKLAQGSTRYNISKNKLVEELIHVPPLKEQQKIAEILSTVDEQIDQTDQLIEKTKELKKGLMQQLLTRGIGHTEFKQSELGEIPVEWYVVAIKEVATTMSGGTPNRSNKSYYEDGTIPWVKTGELKNKYIGNVEEFITDEAIKNSSAKIIEENSVVLAMYGATIGQVSILSFPAATNQACCAVISSDKIYYEYLYYYLKSKKDYLISLGAGGAQPNISQKIIQDIKIILPPIQEQYKMTEILSSVDEEIEGYKEEKAKYEELKKGLMQQLLTGKKRVKV